MNQDEQIKKMLLLDLPKELLVSIVSSFFTVVEVGSVDFSLSFNLEDCSDDWLIDWRDEYASKLSKCLLTKFKFLHK